MFKLSDQFRIFRWQREDTFHSRSCVWALKILGWPVGPEGANLTASLSFMVMLILSSIYSLFPLHSWPVSHLWLSLLSWEIKYQKTAAQSLLQLLWLHSKVSTGFPPPFGSCYPHLMFHPAKGRDAVTPRKQWVSSWPAWPSMYLAGSRNCVQLMSSEFLSPYLPEWIEPGNISPKKSNFKEVKNNRMSKNFGLILFSHCKFLSLILDYSVFLISLFIFALRSLYLLFIAWK